MFSTGRGSPLAFSKVSPTVICWPVLKVPPRARFPASSPGRPPPAPVPEPFQAPVLVMLMPTVTSPCEAAMVALPE